MLFLGVLSVLQLILIPGLLLIRLFPGKRSLIQGAAYVFMLSLLANYAGIFLLVAVGLYLRSVVLAVFLVEAAACLWLYRGELLKPHGGWEKKARDSVSQSLKSFSEWVSKDFWSAGLFIVFGTIALIAILWVLWVWVSNFNTVFQNWDAYASWDRWAVRWAENQFPGDTWEYPQLIPVSFSVTYKFIGTTAVKFFSKSIMPLFTLFIGLMLFDLGRKYRSYGYMLGAGFAVYTIHYFLGGYIADGYVDIPVACFSLMSVYTLLLARALKDPGEIKTTLLLGSLATAAAGVTKQTGLYVMAFYPVLAYLWVLRGRKGFGWRESAVLLLRHFLLALALVLPWYAFAEYHILYGGNTSNIQYVITDIYGGQTLPQRFSAALASLGPYAYVFAFALVSLLVLDGVFREIVVFLIFPFAILWAFFLSYEERNLAVAFPLLAMSVGVGVEAWVARLRATLGKPKPLRVPALSFVLLGLVLLGAATLAWNGEALIARQISQQKLIFKPELNQKLYRFFSSQGEIEPIITSYPVAWLPDLENIWVNDQFKDYDTYKQALSSHPDVTLLLVPLQTKDARVEDEVQQNIELGVYQVIFTESNYMLLRIPAR